MAHFARINQDGIVEEVIVAEQDFIDSGIIGDPSSWIQTSYNTFGGVHVLGGTPFRKNYAAFGFTYDKVRDAFVPPYPQYDGETFSLNEETCLWDSINDTTVQWVWNKDLYTWEAITTLS